MTGLLIGMLIGFVMGWVVFKLVLYRDVERLAKQEIARAAAALKEPTNPAAKPYRTMWGDVTNRPMKKDNPPPC